MRSASRDASERRPSPTPRQTLALSTTSRQDGYSISTVCTHSLPLRTTVSDNFRTCISMATRCGSPAMESHYPSTRRKSRETARPWPVSYPARAARQVRVPYTATKTLGLLLAAWKNHPCLHSISCHTRVCLLTRVSRDAGICYQLARPCQDCSAVLHLQTRR